MTPPTAPVPTLPVRRSRGRALFLLAAIGGVAAGTDCRRASKVPPPAPLLETVEFDDASAASLPDGAPGPRYDTAALAGLARDALLKSGLAAAAAADGGIAEAGGGIARGVVRVRGRIAIEFVEVDHKGLARAAVALRIATRPADAPGALNQELSAGGEQPFAVGPKTDRQAVGQTLVARMVADLIGNYVTRVALATAPPEQVHAAIMGDGGALREEAIRVAGARGLKDEASVLLPLLQNEDERVRDAALGALIALKEQRAVKALTHNRSMRDHREMRKILDAIAILGGDEARDYLSFVAASHDDEEIRKLAADAKARMERRDPNPARGP